MTAGSYLGAWRAETSPFTRQMAWGHAFRTGHEMRAYYITTEEEGISELVYVCCHHGDRVRAWDDTESHLYNTSDTARRRYRARARGLEEVRALFIDSFDSGDPWGSTISHLFGIATVIYLRSGEVAESFTPGLGAHGERATYVGNPDSYALGDEFPDAEYWDGVEDGAYTLDDLHAFYRVLLRYDALLRHYGRDY